MPIEVIPYLAEHEPFVKAFNQRLTDGGTDWQFYHHAEPKWARAGLAAHVGRKYFIAIDEAAQVHGGFCLKTQTFAFHGKAIEAASMQGPVSEGLVDAKYSMLAMRLVRDMERRNPLLFAWGASERIAGLLSRLGWTRSGASLAIRVFNPGAVLRLTPRFKGKTAFRLLAATGLPDLGGRLIHATLSAARGGGRGPRLTAERCDRFGDWADDIWAAAKDSYSLIAQRDAETMNVLIPQTGWPDGLILKMQHQGRVVGWAVVRDTRFQGDETFGDLRVGAVVDSLCEPGLEAAVIRATTTYLRQLGVDLAASLYKHSGWLAAFAANGYLIQKERRPLYLSPALSELVASEPASLAGVHMTPLDGDGPHGL